MRDITFQRGSTVCPGRPDMRDDGMGCGSDVWEADMDFSTEPATDQWRCNNCGNRRPRRTRTAGTEITRTQLRTIAWIRSRIARQDKELRDEDIEMIEDSGLLTISGTFDNPGRFGLMTETRFHVIVGRRGGVRHATLEQVGFSRKYTEIRRFIAGIY